MLSAIGGFVLVSLLLIWGVRLLAHKERDEEEASRLGVELAAVLVRDPRLAGAAILPVATIPLEGRPSVELTGRVPAASARDVALEIASREAQRLRPGMLVVDRLEIVPPAAAPRSA